MMTRDYLTVKVWDLNMENRPLETYQVLSEWNLEKSGKSMSGGRILLEHQIVKDGPLNAEVEKGGNKNHVHCGL